MHIGSESSVEDLLTLGNKENRGILNALKDSNPTLRNEQRIAVEKEKELVDKMTKKKCEHNALPSQTSSMQYLTNKFTSQCSSLRGSLNTR